jgi:O-antigen ligase
VRKITYIASLLLIFFIPSEDSISTPTLGSVARLMGIILAALWLATIVLEGKFRKPQLFHAFVLLFFLWNVVTVFWSSDLESSMQRVETYGQVFILLLIYWDLFQKPEQLMAGLQAYVLGAYVLIGSTIYNYVAGNVAVQYEGRYSATGVNANDVALMLILGLPIGLPIAMHLFFVAGRNIRGTILQAINLLYVPLSIFAIILTGSRTSIIAIIPFGIFLIGTQRIKVRQKIIFFVILCVCLLALLPFIPQSVIDRIGTVGTSISEADLGGRVTMWRLSIAVMAQHPIFGVGSGAIDHEIGGAVHNTFISVATETGFIGFVLFLCILGLVTYRMAVLPGKTSPLWLTIFLTWAIGVFSLSWEFRKATWIILIFLVIQCSFGKQVDEQERDTNLSGNLRQSLGTIGSISQPKAL